MSDWKYFEMPQPRPEQARHFSPLEREELEALIAGQVVSLLAVYGSEEDVEIDVDSSNQSGIEDPRTYRVIGLAEVRTEDNGELAIGQLPVTDDDIDTRPGVYSIVQSDFMGDLKTLMTVHDPSHVSGPPIYHSHGTRVELDALQELHEALGVLRTSYEQTCRINDPLLIPSSYPLVVSDPEFESVVAGLTFDDSY